MTSNRFALLLAIILPAAGAAHAAHAAQSPKNPWNFKLRAEAEARYDDNILTLSDTDIDSIENPAPGTNPLETFGIDQPDDVIFTPSLDLGFDRSPRKGRETSISFAARTNQYLYSTVKDFQEYDISLRQELNRSHKHRTTLNVGGSRTPYYFLRQLKDEDESAIAGTTIHNAATFEKNRASLEISQEIVNRILSVRARYARERRNYNFHFNERDSNSDVSRLEVDLYPAGKAGFRLRPYYQHEQRNARGDFSTNLIVEDDVDFSYDLYGFEARGLWGRDGDHRNILRGYYEQGTRDFPTADPSDTSHFGREDDTKKYGLEYSRELGPNWKLGFSAYHRNVDINIFTGKFDRNVAAVSLGWSFDHRFEGSGRGGEEEE